MISNLFSGIGNVGILNIGIVKFEEPGWLFLAIPLIIITFVLLTINFVKFEKETRAKLIKLRLGVVVTRILIIILLTAALASPFINKKVNSNGDPSIALLVDNSTSMQLFDANTGELETNLKKEVPVTKTYIGYGETSRVGDGVFRQLHRKNLLLVTDGNNDKESMNLYDVLSYAKKFNVSINAIKLGEEKSDVSIAIEGSKTAIIDTEYHYTIKLNNIISPVSVRIIVDGMTAYEGQTDQQTIALTSKFGSVGHHKITAEILTEDFFQENNRFYKTVEVVDKPKILYMANKESPLAGLLSTRYSVTSTSTMPTDLSPYFAVMLNDNMNTITPEEEKTLETYTDDGNGLVVWGGQLSFNGPSSIDVLLPVTPGEVNEGAQDFNFIFVVDMSGVIDNALMNSERYALQIMQSLKERKEKINVVVIDFSYMAHVMSDFKPIQEYSQIESDLTNFRDVSKIDGTYWLRPADLASGLKLAREVLANKTGNNNNNIIVVSDGNIHYEKYFVKAEKELEEFRNQGIRVHSVNVISNDMDDSVLIQVRRRISALGRGMYITSATHITDLFEKKLVVSDPDHFISDELLINAVVTNFNKVTPTPAAKTLITTGTGVPIVTVNSYNKVGAVTTDDGFEWAGTMLQGENLVLFYRIMDWAIGDPNRKKEAYTYVTDARMGEEVKVLYKGEGAPSSDRCNFLEIEDHYECTFAPQQPGFDEILGVSYAVSYDEEYESVGYNEKTLDLLTQETGGLIFPAEKVPQIIEKVKSDAKVETIKRIKIDWWLIGVALLIYLFEVAMRRIAINKGWLTP